MPSGAVAALGIYSKVFIGIHILSKSPQFFCQNRQYFAIINTVMQKSWVFTGIPRYTPGATPDQGQAHVVSRVFSWIPINFGKNFEPNVTAINYSLICIISHATCEMCAGLSCWLEQVHGSSCTRDLMLLPSLVSSDLFLILLFWIPNYKWVS